MWSLAGAGFPAVMYTGELGRDGQVLVSRLRTLTRTASATLLTVTLSACATVHNLPTNVPLGSNIAGNDVGKPVPIYDDDLLLALSFSGGGTRAAAFSFGVLTELDRIRSASDQTKSLLDRIDFISRVSGGSVTAAYFGLKRREALVDFRERFLLRNAEEDLRTRVSLVNLSRALGGGVNDVQFTEWTRTCSMALATSPSERSDGREFGSTPQTFSTARRSCSARPPSTHCAAT